MARSAVISCSNSFLREAAAWRERLAANGYGNIHVPEAIGVDLDDYAAAHQRFYQAIARCDLLFVLNLEKNGIQGYIGPSVFAEIAFAIGLNLVEGKRIDIRCLNALPTGLPWSDELVKWERLGWIGLWEQQ